MHHDSDCQLPLSPVPRISGSVGEGLVQVSRTLSNEVDSDQECSGPLLYLNVETLCHVDGGRH